MSFRSLFGLDAPVAALRRALANDQLAGSYLFVGPHSSGKTALALAFARAAACVEPGTGPFDACGRCQSCLLAAAGKHPEITLISPAGELTQIWQFWDRDGKPSGALSHSLSFAPTVGRRRVYIVERADTLNESAANSLLKVLEEPPPYALFVLLSPHVARMLPTVISRCQLIRIAPAAMQPLAEFVAEKAGVSDERAHVCAAYSEGRTGMALRLASDPVTGDEIGRAVDLAVSLATSEPLGALRLGEAIRRLSGSLKALGQDDSAPGAAKDSAPEDAAPRERVGRRQVAVAVDLLAAAYRDLLALSVGGTDARIVHAERRADLESAACVSDPGRWMNGLEAILVARRRVDQNVSIPLVTDWLAMTLVHSRAA